MEVRPLSRGRLQRSRNCWTNNLTADVSGMDLLHNNLIVKIKGVNNPLSGCAVVDSLLFRLSP